MGLYPIQAGGKRIRPKLTYLLSHALGGKKAWVTAKPAAMALEAIHTYSLVHDDLPSMDDDDFRRGLPTVHKRVGEGKAILIGDALLTEALGWAVQSKLPMHSIYFIQILAQAAGARGMVYGQWLDLSYENSDHLRKNKLAAKKILEIHRYKTGALFGAAFELAVVAATGQRSPKAFEIGTEVGICFQQKDDLLDVLGTSQRLGKTTGKDRKQGKLTLPFAIGTAKAQQILEIRQKKVMKQLQNFLKPRADQPGPFLDFISSIFGRSH